MFTTLLFTLLLYNKLFNVLCNKLYNNRNVNACHLCILIIVKCINEHLIKNKKKHFWTDYNYAGTEYYLRIFLISWIILVNSCWLLNNTREFILPIFRKNHKFVTLVSWTQCQSIPYYFQTFIFIFIIYKKKIFKKKQIFVLFPIFLTLR